MDLDPNPVAPTWDTIAVNVLRGLVQEVVHAGYVVPRLSDTRADVLRQAKEEAVRQARRRLLMDERVRDAEIVLFGTPRYVRNQLGALFCTVSATIWRKPQGPRDRQLCIRKDRETGNWIDWVTPEESYESRACEVNTVYAGAKRSFSTAVEYGLRVLSVRWALR